MAIGKTLPIGNTGIEASYHAIKGSVKARLHEDEDSRLIVNVQSWKDMNARAEGLSPINEDAFISITLTPAQKNEFLQLIYSFLETTPRFEGGTILDPEPFVEEVIEEPGDGQEGGQGEEDPGDGVYPDGETYEEVEEKA